MSDITSKIYWCGIVTEIQCLGNRSYTQTCYNSQNIYFPDNKCRYVIGEIRKMPKLYYFFSKRLKNFSYTKCSFIICFPTKQKNSSPKMKYGTAFIIWCHKVRHVINTSYQFIGRIKILKWIWITKCFIHMNDKNCSKVLKNIELSSKSDSLLIVNLRCFIFLLKWFIYVSRTCPNNL